MRRAGQGFAAFRRQSHTIEKRKQVQIGQCKLVPDKVPRSGNCVVENTDLLADVGQNCVDCATVRRCPCVHCRYVRGQVGAYEGSLDGIDEGDLLFGEPGETRISGN